MRRSRLMWTSTRLVPGSNASFHTSRSSSARDTLLPQDSAIRQISANSSGWRASRRPAIQPSRKARSRTTGPARRSSGSGPGLPSKRRARCSTSARSAPGGRASPKPSVSRRARSPLLCTPSTRARARAAGAAAMISRSPDPIHDWSIRIAQSSGVAEPGQVPADSRSQPLRPRSNSGGGVRVENQQNAGTRLPPLTGQANRVPRSPESRKGETVRIRKRSEMDRTSRPRPLTLPRR